MENWKKTFGIIWSGQLASILSSSVVGYAIIFWMSIETGSAEVLALAAIAGMLPQSLLGPVVGVYVDRWDRKRTMILADSFIAFCTLILAVLFWFDVAQMWHIYILLACRSVGSAFHTPSMQASVPLLAPEAQLTRVAGVNQIINSLSNIIGPALGAVLISFTGIGKPFRPDRPALQPPPLANCPAPGAPHGPQQTVPPLVRRTAPGKTKGVSPKRGILLFSIREGRAIYTPCRRYCARR